MPKEHKYVAGLADDGWRKLKVVLKYLCGEIDLAHIGLNENNALQILRIAIIFDLAISLHNYKRPKDKLVLKRGTNELRTIILEKMNYLESFHTFTRTLDLNNFNWTIERSAVQGKISTNILILALFASKVLEKEAEEAKEEVKLHGSKGGSGSGKSISNRERLGVLNADYAKSLLRWKTKIQNQKVHFEGSKVIFSPCFKKIASGLFYLGRRQNFLYYTIDMRMTTLETVITYLVEPAIKRDSMVSLKDFDVPLLTSINRMFKRTPTGKELLQELKIIEDGFKETRENRKQIIEYIEQCDLIQEYELYFMGKLVVQKKEGKFEIIPENEKEYDICLNYPGNELERCLNLPINDQYIRKALERGDFLPEEAILVTQIFAELKEKIIIQKIQEALKRGDILAEEVIFATQMFTELKEKITVREAYEAHLNS